MGNKLIIEMVSEKKIKTNNIPWKLSSINLSAFFTIPTGPARLSDNVLFWKETKIIPFLMGYYLLC